MLFYDDASNYVGVLISVMQEKQSSVTGYVNQTYDNVNVFAHENWMRLDWNKDGSLSMEATRKNLNQFYDFLKNYEYIENATKIKSQVYEQAVKYLRQDKAGEQPNSQEQSNTE